MMNICRPFLLYSDFLPPQEKAHNDWQYLSFGYFDGVSVGNNIFLDGKSDFRLIWDSYIEQTQKLDGSYTAQTIYGFRSDVDGTEDDEYWEIKESDNQDDNPKDTDYKCFPFLFLSLLQVKETGKNFENNWSNHTGFEKAINENVNVRVRTYLTLDNSDIILTIRCKKYEDGAGIIEKLHLKENDISEFFKMNLSYSFTVASINRKYLNSDKISAHTEMLNDAQIYMIEKEPGSIGPIYQAIQDKYQGAAVHRTGISGKSCLLHETVLGCNDELITLSNIKWADFLELFKDRIGLLNHSSSLYQNCLLGVTTIIGKTIPDVKESAFNSGKEGTENLNPPENPHASFSKSLRDKLQSMVSKGDRNSCSKNILTHLLNVVNSLEKLETMPFRNYLFSLSAKPVEMVIDFFNELESKQDGGKDEDFYYEEFFEFINSLNLCMQNSSRSDRQFTQSPDFNVRVSSTLAKLNALYNTFLVNVTGYLNGFRGDDVENHYSHRYQFLTCPGVSGKMCVKELFLGLSDNKRLFLLELPDSQTYNPKMMMNLMVHEAGHFVGNSIWGREKRFHSIKKALVKAVVWYFKNNLKEVYIDQNASYFWRDMEKRIEEEIDCLVNNKEWRYKQYRKHSMPNDDLEILEKLRYHSRMAQILLSDAIYVVLVNHQEKLWAYLLERYYIMKLIKVDKKNDEDAAGKRNRLLIHIHKLTEELFYVCEMNEKVFNITNILAYLMYLHRECVCDMLCILTLKISMKEYLDTFCQSAIDRGIDDIFHNNIARTAMVTNCIRKRYTEDEKEFVWGNEVLREFREDEKELFEGKTNILTFIKTIINAHKFPDEKSNEVDVILVKNPDICSVVAEYLGDVKKTYTLTRNKKEIMTIRQIHSVMDGGNIEHAILEIQNYIETGLKK